MMEIDEESWNDTAPMATHEVSSSSEGINEDGMKLLSVDEIIETAAELAANPYQYELHLKYIKVCKAVLLLDELRAAREAFSAAFPLSEDIWMDWIRDERLLASTMKEKRALITLYLRAVNDYLSIAIWKDYVEFVVDEYKDGLAVSAENPDALWLTLEQVRGVCAQALANTSNYVSKSHIIWNIIRDLEVYLLESSQNKDQEGHVRNMYRERLKVPHSAIQDTFNDYSSFETKYDNVRYEERLQTANASYSATQKVLQKLDQFEMKLSQTNNSVDTYRAYIEHEMSSKDKARVRTLYERALIIHCLDVSLWDEYITFLFSHSKLANIILPVTERAVRNCSWSGDLWAHYIRLLEEFRKPKEEVKQTVERGLLMVAATSSLEESYKVCNAFCCYEVRQIKPDDIPGSEHAIRNMRRTFIEAIKHLKEKFPPGDPYFRLERGLIQIELHVLKETDRVRKLYEEYTKKHPSNSDMWIEYAQFERDYGASNAVRDVFKKAITKQLDWPDRVIQAWLLYETIFGTVSSYYEAASRIKQAISLTQKRHAKAATNAPESSVYQKVLHQPQQFQPTPQTISATYQSWQPSNNEKTSTMDLGDSQQQSDRNLSLKRATTNNNVAVVDNTVEVHEKASMSEPQTMSDPLLDDEYKIIENSSADFTIYMVGHYDESLVKNFFKDCGFITDIINDSEGVFVEFRDLTSARTAMELNGAILNNAPITIKPCRPQKQAWEFSNDQDPRTVYVSHLPVGLEKKWLREKFEAFGNIREVRLREKKTVAYAYVEFTEPESATNALALDNTIVKEDLPPMRVAISNPHLKDQKKEEQVELFLSNLPRTWSEGHVKALFKDYEGLKKVRVLLDQKTNQPRGIAFVEFNTADQAKEALKTNSTKSDGRVIAVSLADPNYKRNQDQNQNKERSQNYSNSIKKHNNSNSDVSLNRGGRGGFRGVGRGRPGLDQPGFEQEANPRSRGKSGRGRRLAVQPRKESTTEHVVVGEKDQDYFRSLIS